MFFILKISGRAAVWKRLWRPAGALLLLACLLANPPASRSALAQTLSGGDNLPRPACGTNSDVFFYSNNQRWSYSSGGVSEAISLGEDAAQTPLADLRLGDFDGDGLSDLFTATGSDWRYSSAGQQPWQILQNSNVPLGELAFGDFDGDGKTDVFTATGTDWRFSSAGTQPWQVLQSSNLPLDSLAFGDFDGDGKTDVFTVSGSRWMFSSAGGQPWQTLQTQDLLPLTLASLRFGDFDGDGQTDVFTSYVGNWYLSSGGTAALTQIGNSNLPLSDLRFDDFDGDGKTDVFSIGSGYWRYSSAGRAPWRLLSTTTFPHDMTIDDLRFGNFDAAAARDPSMAYADSSDYGPQEDIISADFNADGLLDLSTVHSDLKSFSPFINLTASGDEQPHFSANVNYPLQNSPSELAVGDFNSDGRPDLAITTHVQNTAGFLDIALNTTGTQSKQLSFLLTPEIPLNTIPSSLQVADFNQDGRDDLAYTTSYAASASVLLNQTSPGGVGLVFSQPASFLVDAQPFGLAAGDFNGDGLLDLATADLEGKSISLLLNQTALGDGVVDFARQTSLVIDRSLEAVITADLNRDGRLDLAAASANRDQLFVFLNKTPRKASALSFSGPFEFDVPNLFNFGQGGPHSLAALDLDQDGRLDLALGNLVSSSVAILFNATPPGASAASFTSPTHFRVGDLPLDLAAGDFNQDGLPDLAATQDTYKFSLLTNQTQPAALTMQDGSGQSAPVGEPFPTPLGVKVSDACGKGLPGVQVAFNAPSSGPGAALSAAVAVTGSDGVASVSAIANNQAGSYKITAAIPGAAAQLDYELSNTGSRLYLPLISAISGH